MSVRESERVKGSGAQSGPITAKYCIVDAAKESVTVSG